jgi:chemotaxis protein MotB
MTQKLIIAGLFIGSVFFSSCGTGKKLEAANTQIQQLQSANTQLQSANSELASKQKALETQVNTLITSNKSVKDEFSRYKSDCEASREQLRQYQDALKADYNALDEMEKKIDDALADFKGKGVEVYQKDRIIYVDMQDNLMYKRGSSALGAEGKKALANLATALNNYPKLKVVVVGHTDDKKFKNSGTDNLSLSTERANGVVRVLRDCKVDPVRLTAAGKGKYDPIADNATAEGRAKNRRTEIILRPDLVKLWESVQK